MTRWDMMKTPANYAELTPVGFLKRVARVFPHHPAVVHGSKSFTWAQTAERCRRCKIHAPLAGLVPVQPQLSRS